MKSPLRGRIRIGQISYTNCIPFYHRLNGEGLEFSKAVPAQINAAMRRGDLDIAPISSLEYLLHPRDYRVLTPFVIGARDFSGSVILFSREKIEGLNGAEIAVTKESLSSAALLRILLKFRYKFDNEFVTAESEPAAMLQKYKAALVIGDDALFYAPKEFVYKYDLSELWWNWTEKPFCFALWAVRREYAESHPVEVTAFSQLLQKNLDRNLTDIEGLIRDSLNLTFLDPRFSKVFGYLFNLSYGLDSAMMEGLDLYYRLAHRLKLAPKARAIDFFEPLKTRQANS